MSGGDDGGKKGGGCGIERVGGSDKNNYNI